MSEVLPKDEAAALEAKITPMTLRITKSPRRKLRLASAMFDMSYSAIVESALQDWFKKHGVVEKLMDAGKTLS